MISKLATALCDKGKKPRPTAYAIVVHTTGSGVVENAKKEGVDPFKFTCDTYQRGSVYPHYLIGYDGKIVSFCDEARWAAHAAWRDWEADAYASNDWWRKWASDYHDKVVAVEPSFYADWDVRWGERGFASPVDLLAASSKNRSSSPNKVAIGVELLDAKPFTAQQVEALAKLVLDIAGRYGWPIGSAQTWPWPNQFVLGHSDIGPCRRWARAKGDKGTVPKAGVAWDPGAVHDLWDRLRMAVGVSK